MRFTSVSYFLLVLFFTNYSMETAEQFLSVVAFKDDNKIVIDYLESINFEWDLNLILASLEVITIPKDKELFCIIKKNCEEKINKITDFLKDNSKIDAELQNKLRRIIVVLGEVFEAEKTN